MSKTARIITATLLTIATIGLVTFGVKKAKQNKRTIPTYAANTIVEFTDMNNYRMYEESPDVNSTTTSKYRYMLQLTSTNSNKILKILPGPYTIGEQTFHTTEQDLTNYTYSWTTNENINFINVTANRQLLYISQQQTLTHRYDIEIHYVNDISPTITTHLIVGQKITLINPPISIPYVPVFTTKINVYGNISLLQRTQNNAFATGYNTSEAFNHPIALQPLMLNILTMPFTFITQAFDVTLWPGTAYEFNLANFIKGIIAIFAILFIIKMFTSGFSIIGNYTNNAQERKLNKSKIQVNKATARRQNKLADKGK